MTDLNTKLDELERLALLADTSANADDVEAWFDTWDPEKVIELVAEVRAQLQESAATVAAIYGHYMSADHDSGTQRCGACGRSAHYTSVFDHAPNCWIANLPSATRAHLARVERIETAAQALIDRWETPLWKDVPATGTFIAELRASLAPEQKDARSSKRKRA